MVDVKAIRVEPIRSDVANPFVKRHHYSGKVTQNSQLHFGAFYDGILHGVMSFGPSLDKRKIVGLVRGTLWNEFLELNRMAFDDYLPKNSESRCIAVAMHLIKKHYPQIKWIVSFADGAQCGDGAIYRASGFLLTGIKKNTTIWQAPDGTVATDLSLRLGMRSAATRVSRESMNMHKMEHFSGASSMKMFKDAGYKPLMGFQLRYLYFIDKAYRSRLTVQELPYSKIDEMGAGMYKGVNVKIADRKPCAGSETVTRSPIQGKEGGSIPTPALIEATA